MAAVPRTASTGAPTSDGGAVPVYSDASPIREAEEKRVIHRFASFADGYGSAVIARTDRGVVSAEGATFTGRTAVDRAVVIGNQIAAATNGSAADAAQLVREYRKRTGSFPDLSQLGNLGTGGSGSDEGPMVSELPQQASVLGFGVGTWLLLSAIGLVLLLVYGKKGGR